MTHEHSSDIECVDLVELVTEYLEGTLDAQRRDTIDAHLRLCDGCDTYVEQLRQTRQHLGHIPLHTAHNLPRKVRRELLAAFRAEYPR
jgi:anti-sigma factor RsiW